MIRRQNEVVHLHPYVIEKLVYMYCTEFIHTALFVTKSFILLFVF